MLNFRGRKSLNSDFKFLTPSTTSSIPSWSRRSYAAAVATRRVPRSIELKVRSRIDQLVGKIIEESIDESDISDHVQSFFCDLNDEDRKVLFDRVSEIVSAITPENSLAWRVDAQSVEAYKARGRKNGA